MFFLKWRCQGQAAESAAAAQRDIGLAVGKGAAAKINDNPVEGFPLAFMNRHCPGKIQRILNK